ncbi:MAG: arginine deiminase-related protein [Saprospiraceae bacterium]
MIPQQLSNNILMVRPVSFGYNSETGNTNAFQKKIDQLSELEIQNSVLQEFDQMVEQLRNAGIQVMVIQDNKEQTRPDAIFPNNWISFHSDGTLITYPMQSLNRRFERREDIISEIEKNFKVERRFSLEIFEDKEQYLEGTGSMIFDNVHRIIYACLSPRTDIQVLQHLASLINYSVFFFYAKDENGVDIYHTNVMMALGKDFVVICLDSVVGEKQSELIDLFKESNKEIIAISFDQMNHFAGNMLQLIAANGDPILVMSQSAFDSLLPSQLSQLTAKTKLLIVNIPTIETIGGGSARCMMAEIFLNRK